MAQECCPGLTMALAKPPSTVISLFVLQHFKAVLICDCFRCVQGANLFERMVTALVRIAQTPASPDAPTTVQEDERALRFPGAPEDAFTTGLEAWSPDACPHTSCLVDFSRVPEAFPLDGLTWFMSKGTHVSAPSAASPAGAVSLLAESLQLLTSAVRLPAAGLAVLCEHPALAGGVVHEDDTGGGDCRCRRVSCREPGHRHCRRRR